MKKVVRITESELRKVIKKVLNEASPLAAPASASPPTFSMKRPEVKFADVPPPPQPKPVAPQTIFGVGDRNPKILQFQKDLVALGYNVGKKGPDGIFGPATEAAVKDFQSKHGIKVSGRVGPPTMGKLKSAVSLRQANSDPNAEWNQDRAYTNPTTGRSTQIPDKPVPEWARDRAYDTSPGATQPTTPKKPAPRPNTTKAGGSGILTRKLRDRPNKGWQ